jgi:excinuclease ABC subunit B
LARRPGFSGLGSAAGTRRLQGVSRSRCQGRDRKAESLRSTHTRSHQSDEIALARGTYRKEAATTEIYPAESDDEVLPVEPFDDEIEAFSVFDSLTDKVLRKVPGYTVFPKTHYGTPRETFLSTVEQI